MTSETVDHDMMNSIADEKAMDAMSHMEESGYSDEAESAMELSLRLDALQRLEDTLDSLPEDVVSLSWHLDPDGVTTSVTALVRVGERSWNYPGGAETLVPVPFAVQALKQSTSRVVADGLPLGDHITVCR